MSTRSINAFSSLVKSYKNTLISLWKSDNRTTVLLYDRTLLCIIFFLVILGFIMVTSASMPIGYRLLRDPFFFAKRDICYLFLAVIVASFILHIPIKCWQYYSVIMLFISFIMLITVLLFGHIINGATRWIVLGPIRIQPAEVVKISFCCYLSDYLARKLAKINNNSWEFYKPLAVLSLLLILLLEQPDFGTAILLFITTLVMLFLSGVKIRQFLIVIILSTTIISVLIINNPYRMHRITSFLHPWKDPYKIGYQLTQSLIALGRGNLFGRGLGNSRQKFYYLPEAHTDFIFSVLGEELGYIGAMIVMYNIFFVAFRAMSIGHRAIKIGKYFSGFFSCSIGIWLSVQIIINIGASTGILPTKGLTLPLISYGGSSLIVVLIALMVVLRVDYETRLANIQAFHRRSN